MFVVFATGNHEKNRECSYRRSPKQIFMNFRKNRKKIEIDLLTYLDFVAKFWKIFYLQIFQETSPKTDFKVMPSINPSCAKGLKIPR